MKKHALISIVILVVLIIIPLVAYANFATAATSSFGGRVITPRLPIATCGGFGVGPILLSSNLESFGSAILSASSTGQPTAARVSSVISGIYGAIPFYANYNLSTSVIDGSFAPVMGTVPRTGDWILGKASIIPNFSNCTLTGTGTGNNSGGIPFPVRTTNSYQVSHH